MTRPRVVWSNIVNLGGVYSDKPICCRLKSGVGEPTYWDSTGDLDVKTVGERPLSPGSECTQFSSRSRRDVAMWTAGARAAMKLIRSIAHKWEAV